jgi:uncharacterized RDD family membrane protein YckC
MASPSPRILQPLSAGNIVNVSLSVYRANFKPFFKLSAIATGWAMVPIITGAVLALFFLAVRNYYALLGLLIPAWMALTLFCVVRFLSTAAALSRLTFSQLTSEPEPIDTAQRFVRSRQWGFLGNYLLRFLIFMGIATAAYFAAAIAIVVVVGFMGGFAWLTNPNSPFENPVPILIAALLVALIILAVALGFIWFASRFSLAEVPLAIETNTTATESIGRSWDLTTGSVVRIGLAFTAAFLVTLPLQVVVQVASIASQGAISIMNRDGNPALASLSMLSSWGISLVVGVVLMPLWQGIKGVMYYDLRNRREGLGLALPDVPVDGDAPPPAEATRFFNAIQLQTPESVELDFTLAGIGNRSLALLLDYTILGFLFTGFILLWLFLSNQALEMLNNAGIPYSRTWPWSLAIGLLISFALFTGYFIYFETLRQGQTPGKRLTNIRVIRDDGRPVGLSQAVLRSLLRPIDDLLFAGALLILLGQKEKRIGDLVAGTLVIQEPFVSPKPDLSLSNEGEALAKELPQLTKLESLSPEDFATIRAYLQRRRQFSTRARTDLGLALARQVREKVQLETIPPNLTADQFLDAVYLAYQRQR